MLLILVLATVAASAATSKEEFYVIEYCKDELVRGLQTLAYCQTPGCNDVYHRTCGHRRISASKEEALGVINEKNTCYRKQIGEIPVFDFFMYRRETCDPEPGFVFEHLYRVDKKANLVKMKPIKRTVEKEIKSYVKEEVDALTIQEEGDDIMQFFAAGSGINVKVLEDVRDPGSVKCDGKSGRFTRECLGAIIVEDGDELKENLKPQE